MSKRIFKDWDNLALEEKEDFGQESNKIISELQEKGKDKDYYIDALMEIEELKGAKEKEIEFVKFKYFWIGIVSLIGFIIFCEILSWVGL